MQPWGQILLVAFLRSLLLTCFYWLKTSKEWEGAKQGSSDERKRRDQIPGVAGWLWLNERGYRSY